MPSKVCFKCGSKRELSEFYKHKQMKDGHLNKCKSCTRKDVGKHRSDNIDKIREYDRNRPNKKKRYADNSARNKKMRAENPEKCAERDRKYREANKDHIAEYKKAYYAANKEKCLERSRAWCAANQEKVAEIQKRYRLSHPDKYKAHTAVNNALRDGKIKRPDECEMCGHECDPHAHHWSYKEEHWLDVEWLCPACHMQLHASKNVIIF